MTDRVIRHYSSAFCNKDFFVEERDTFIPKVRPTAQVWRNDEWQPLSKEWNEVVVGDHVRFKPHPLVDYDSLFYIVSKIERTNTFGTLLHVAFSHGCSPPLPSDAVERDILLGQMKAVENLQGSDLSSSFQTCFLRTLGWKPSTIETDLRVSSTDMCYVFTVSFDGFRNYFHVEDVSWLNADHRAQNVEMNLLRSRLRPVVGS